MASFASSIFSPFRNTYRYLQHSAHENPVIFFSLLIGSVGPISVLVVPPIRKAYGWKPAERIPTSYPLPQRERTPVTAYDDE
ncbi:n19m, NADH-ubiquinone oxidoreductase 9.5 kDa subunit [Thecaphora frezii]